METVIKLMIINQEKLIGSGSIILLEKIQEHSSIKGASKSMGMSYSKALRRLRIMEQDLGFAVVISEKGGRTHGGSRLTPEGVEFINKFRKIENTVLNYAQELMKQEFLS